MEKLLELLSSINYWEKKPEFNLGFIRERYVNSICKSIGNKLVKVIIGQRRVGKSYIVRQLMYKLNSEQNVNSENIFYLNKEMFEFEDIKTAKDLFELISLYEYRFKPKNKIYIFIDEVQNIIDWEKVVVSLAQHPIKDYELFITGSNSKLLSGEFATFLSGRYVQTEVFPFSYNEFLEYDNLTNSKESFLKYIRTSGLPELFNLSQNETKIHYFQSLKNTVLLKDIIHRHKIRDYILLEDIFLFLLHNVGNMTSVPSIIRYFKSKNRRVDYSTVSQYISYMQEAFIIHSASRFSLKTKELLSGEKKYFLNDLGFRNYLYPNLMSDIGSMLENVTFMHLKISGYSVKLGYENSYEVGFFAEKNQERQYVQVSYVMPTLETISREFGALERVKDNLPKYVITMDDMLVANDKGIIHRHIWDYIYELT